jgi:cation transport ATPase
MKTTLRVCALVLIVFTSAGQLRADIAKPKPSATPASEPKRVMTTGMEIVPKSDVYQAHLQISQSTVAELRNALNAGTTGRSFTERISHSPISTIVAGLLLFMSVSFAGVWFARSASSRSRGQKAAAAVLISVAMLGAAAIITRANAGPPPGYFWRNLPKNLSAGQSTSGGVIVEIVPDEGAAIKLIIPLKQNPARNRDDE